MDVGEVLRAAEAALEREQDREALAHLLEAWRATRQPRIADVIDHVSQDVTTGVPPLQAKPGDERRQALQRLAARRDPATLERLVRPAWRPCEYDRVVTMRELVQWPDDPRIARYFASELETMHELSSWSQHYHYRPMLCHLVALRDVRTQAVIRAMLDRRDQRGRDAARAVEWDLRDRGGLDAVLAVAVVPLTGADELALGRLEARFAERTTARTTKATTDANYLAAIHADPDDLALRAVYADWLQERGDPRGEFIALQLARAQGRELPPAATRRERQLLAEHGIAWAGALDGAFERTGRRFEGGFSSAARSRTTPSGCSTTPRGRSCTRSRGARPRTCWSCRSCARCMASRKRARSSSRPVRRARWSSSAGSCSGPGRAR